MPLCKDTTQPAAVFSMLCGETPNRPLNLRAAHCCRSRAPRASPAGNRLIGTPPILLMAGSEKALLLTMLMPRSLSAFSPVLLRTRSADCEIQLNTSGEGGIGCGDEPQRGYTLNFSLNL